MTLPNLHLTIDGIPTPVEAPSATAAIGGYDDFTGTIKESDVRRLPPTVAQDSELILYSDGGVARWAGRIAISPRLRDDGKADIKASGYKALAEKSHGRRLYQSRSYDEWTDAVNEPFEYSTNLNEILEIEALNGAIKATIPGESSTGGLEHNLAFWAPGTPGGITRVEWNKTTNHSNANQSFRLSRLSGPGGTPTVVSSQLWNAAAPYDSGLIASAQDCIFIANRTVTTHTPTGWRTARIANLRVSGIASDGTDSYTVQAVLQNVASALSYGDGVSSNLSTNALPLDWKDGSWADLMDYVCMLQDGWWRVLDDRGSGPYLEANTWPNSKTWTVSQTTGAELELAPLETYDGVVIHYFSPGGAPLQATAGTVTAGSNVYEDNLLDNQHSSALASSVATELNARVTVSREQGNIFVTSARDETGRDDPFGILPGDNVTVTDRGPGEATTHRVYGTELTPLGMRLVIEEEALPTLRHTTVRELESARRHRTVRVPKSRRRRKARR